MLNPNDRHTLQELKRLRWRRDEIYMWMWMSIIVLVGIVGLVLFVNGS